MKTITVKPPSLEEVQEFLGENGAAIEVYPSGYIQDTLKKFRGQNKVEGYRHVCKAIFSHTEEGISGFGYLLLTRDPQDSKAFFYNVCRGPEMYDRPFLSKEEAKKAANVPVLTRKQLHTDTFPLLIDIF